MIPSYLNESAKSGHAAFTAGLQCNVELLIGARRFVELNAQTAETSLAENRVIAEATLGAQSFAEVMDLHAHYFPALITKAFAYLRHTDEIVMQTQRGILGAMRQYGQTLTDLPEDTDGVTLAEVGAGQTPTDSLLTADRQDPSSDARSPIVDSAGGIISSVNGPKRNDTQEDGDPDATTH
nr:hypothetical protein HUO10_005361 [Paraburkholderia busanensis]